MPEDTREWKTERGRLRPESGGRRLESSGILKKFRGRFGVARLKAIESRFGFRYGGFLADWGLGVRFFLGFLARE
jgi:hypothetical protein